jgi:hypothetical protein
MAFTVEMFLTRTEFMKILLFTLKAKIREEESGKFRRKGFISGRKCM